MSSKRKGRRSLRAPLNEPNDLTDWAAIGMIVVASSVLVWAPLLA
jgi:hypothetical protein